MQIPVKEQVPGGVTMRPKASIVGIRKRFKFWAKFFLPPDCECFPLTFPFISVSENCAADGSMLCSSERRFFDSNSLEFGEWYFRRFSWIEDVTEDCGVCFISKKDWGLNILRSPE